MAQMNRYQKQLQLSNWSEKEQNILAKSTVLVIGAGGLANAALPYLAMTGIGKIIILDGDKIESSNLGRQALFTEEEIGKFKAETAAQKLKALNSSIEILYENEFAKRTILEKYIPNSDIILDCTDNFPIRYIIDDICKQFDKPWIYAGLYAWEGQIALLNGIVHGENKKSGTYRSIYPNPPQGLEIPDCDTAGVMATTVGFMGLQEAKEAIFYLVGWPSKANGHLVHWNCLNMTHYSVLN